METIQLKAQKREDVGKKAAKALRREGKVPAIIYGAKGEQKVVVDGLALYKTLSTEENGTFVIVELDIDGDKRHGILKELQYHPITDELLHADFQQIDLQEPMKTRLPVELKGTPMGVKIKGGSLRFHHRKMKVVGLPEKLPVAVPVTVTDMDVMDKVKVADITLPEGITCLEDPETRIVSIAPPKRGPGGKKEGDEDAPAEAAAAAPAAG